MKYRNEAEFAWKSAWRAARAYGEFDGSTFQRIAYNMLWSRQRTKTQKPGDWGRQVLRSELVAGQYPRHKVWGFLP